MGRKDSEVVSLTGLTVTRRSNTGTLFVDGFGANDGVLRAKPRRGVGFALPTGLGCTCPMPTASRKHDTGTAEIFDCIVCGGVSSKVTDLSRRHPSLPKLPGQRTISDADLDALSARSKPRVNANIRAALREAGLIKDGDEA